jgi:hypothetical protein
MAVNPWIRYATDVPPGFEHEPWLYMLTLFSLIMINLLALEWMWRIAWGAVERPHPIQHPITVLRTILFLTALQIVLRVGPDVVRFSLWYQLTPSSRFIAYQIDHYLDILSFFPFSVAWLIAYLTMDLLHYQLDKKPIPMHLWPTPSQLQRPLKIGVAVMIISAAITVFG